MAASSWTCRAWPRPTALRPLHVLKTGRLIRRRRVWRPADRREGLGPYRAFAAEVGLLFQIVDDILDEAGDEQEMGKSLGKDREQEKTTYVSRFGLDDARVLAAEAATRADARLAALPGDTGALAALTAYIRDRRR